MLMELYYWIKRLKKENNVFFNLLKQEKYIMRQKKNIFNIF